MDIGKKIKELRTAKMMTQSELAGHEITRNMLSRIENGAALPSLGTVMYLSKRLGVPVGVILSDDADEVAFAKNNILKNIKKAYKEKNYELCRDMCKDLGVGIDDDEINMIMARTSYFIAERDMEEGRLKLASKGFEEALMYAEKTVYEENVIVCSSNLLLRHIYDISPMLADADDAILSQPYFEETACVSEWCRYLTFINSIDASEVLPDIAYYKDKLSSDIYIKHISAKYDMKHGEISRAYDTLKALTENELMDKRFMLYLVCKDMEECSKELGDYKNAYEYSKEKMSLIELMLSL